MLTCNVVTVQHRKHTDSGKIYIQARTSRKDIFLLFGNEDSKFHNCTTELLTRRNCIFFFNQQDSSLESQGITCKYFISKWTDLPAFNDSFSGKNGMTTDTLSLAIKRCHKHNNPSVTTFLRGKNKQTHRRKCLGLSPLPILDIKAIFLHISYNAMGIGIA